MDSPQEWYRDNFMISTSHKLIQPTVVNDAFDKDPAIYWVNRMPESDVEKMLSNSLCLGLYELPKSTAELAGLKDPRQIGLTRVITDWVSFAYVTDVYVLEEFRGRGLGKWMIECLNEVLQTWPQLRGTSLLTSDEQAKKFYRNILGTEPLAHGLETQMRVGPGSAFYKK